MISNSYLSVNLAGLFTTLTPNSVTTDIVVDGTRLGEVSKRVVSRKAKRFALLKGSRTSGDGRCVAM